MNKQQKKQLARKFGSNTGKLKKKHLFRAKASLEHRWSYSEVDFLGKPSQIASLDTASLKDEEINHLLGGSNDAQS
jgi:hypothetical protein